MGKFVWGMEALLKFPSAPECLVSVLREKTYISFLGREGKVVWPGESECTLQKRPCEAAHCTSGTPVSRWDLSLLELCE